MFAQVMAVINSNKTDASKAMSLMKIFLRVDGLGMAKGAIKLRERIQRLLGENMEAFNADTKVAAEAWLASYSDGEQSRIDSKALETALKAEKAEVAPTLLELAQYFIKKSFWIFGGDG